MSGDSRSAFPRNPAVSLLASSKDAGAGEVVAMRRKKPLLKKSTVRAEAP